MTILTIKDFPITAKYTEFEAEITIYVKKFVDRPATYFDPAELEIDYNVSDITIKAPNGKEVDANSLEQYIDYSDLDEKAIKAMWDY